jgi:hypothetical protein
MYTLENQPVIQLEYLNNKSTLRNKTIEVFVYKWIDFSSEIEELKKNTNGSVKSVETLVDSMKDNKTGLSGKSVSETLQNMWTMITNAGKLYKDLKKSYEILPLNFSYPTETSDYKLRFRDLKIHFKEYGKYQLLFRVDGIDTQLSDIITVGIYEPSEGEAVKIKKKLKISVYLKFIFYRFLKGSCHHSYHCGCFSFAFLGLLQYSLLSPLLFNSYYVLYSDYSDLEPPKTRNYLY